MDYYYLILYLLFVFVDVNYEMLAASAATVMRAPGLNRRVTHKPE